MRGELERARDEQSKAITQVEKVMNSLSRPQEWSSFLQQYAELYAQTALTDVRLQQEEQARELIRNFVQIAGSQELKSSLSRYIADIPNNDENMSEEEQRENQELVKKIEHLRKQL
jgi:vacuolar-type H+-ATPase catalytic subunit A/Vma1